MAQAGQRGLAEAARQAQHGAWVHLGGGLGGGGGLQAGDDIQRAGLAQEERRQMQGLCAYPMHDLADPQNLLLQVQQARRACAAGPAHLGGGGEGGGGGLHSTHSQAFTHCCRGTACRLAAACLGACWHQRSSAHVPFPARHGPGRHVGAGGHLGAWLAGQCTGGLRPGRRRWRWRGVHCQQAAAGWEGAPHALALHTLCMLVCSSAGTLGRHACAARRGSPCCRRPLDQAAHVSRSAASAALFAMQWHGAQWQHRLHEPPAGAAAGGCSRAAPGSCTCMAGPASAAAGPALRQQQGLRVRSLTRTGRWSPLCSPGCRSRPCWCTLRLAPVRTQARAPPAGPATTAAQGLQRAAPGAQAQRSLCALTSRKGRVLSVRHLGINYWGGGGWAQPC